MILRKMKVLVFNMNLISAEELYKIKASTDIVVLDVREAQELKENPFKQLKVLHIPMNDVVQRLDELDDSKHIIVACAVGGRSARVCEFLETRGYENVSNLTGGILAWQNSTY